MNESSLKEARAAGANYKRLTKLVALLDAIDVLDDSELRQLEYRIQIRRHVIQSVVDASQEPEDLLERPGRSL